jgi:hypothetical protein
LAANKVSWPPIPDQTAIADVPSSVGLVLS